MKISELIKLHGVPVKVTMCDFLEGNWFEIIADKRETGYPGFYASGYADKVTDNFDDWELYVAPKPKKKLYAYLSKEIGTSSVSIYSGSYVIALLTEEYDSKHMYLVRAPQFDCEIDQ